MALTTITESFLFGKDLDKYIQNPYFAGPLTPESTLLIQSRRRLFLRQCTCPEKVKTLVNIDNRIKVVRQMIETITKLKDNLQEKYQKSLEELEEDEDSSTDDDDSTCDNEISNSTSSESVVSKPNRYGCGGFVCGMPKKKSKMEYDAIIKKLEEENAFAQAISKRKDKNSISTHRKQSGTDILLNDAEHKLKNKQNIYIREQQQNYHNNLNGNFGKGIQSVKNFLSLVLGKNKSNIAANQNDILNSYQTQNDHLNLYQSQKKLKRLPAGNAQDFDNKSFEYEKLKDEKLSKSHNYIKERCIENKNYFQSNIRATYEISSKFIAKDEVRPFKHSKENYEEFSDYEQPENVIKRINEVLDSILKRNEITDNEVRSLV